MTDPSSRMQNHAGTPHTSTPGAPNASTPIPGAHHGASGGLRPRSTIWERLLAVVALLVLSAGCIAATIYFTKPVVHTYSQATPDDLIRSAVAMVKNGDARRLPNLIYADSDHMRASLDKLGILLGHLQRLAGSLAKAFPEKTEQLKEYIQNAAGKDDSILSLFNAGAAGGNRQRGPGQGGPGGGTPGKVEVRIGTDGVGAGPGGGAGAAAEDPDPGQMIRLIVTQMFTDPYGWIDRNAERLGTMQVTDDTASITVDGKPAFGIGIPLKLDKGKWYIALPTNMPGISDAMPKVPEQWRMIDYLIILLDKVVVELDADVRANRLRTLSEIAERAQDKIIFPVGIWVISYAADFDARERADRAFRHYRERQKKWAVTYAETKGLKEKDAKLAVSPKLIKAMETIAKLEIEPLIRSRKWERPTDLTDPQFLDLITPWMRKHGLTVDITGTVPMVGEEVDAAVVRWEAKQTPAPGSTPAKK